MRPTPRVARAWASAVVPALAPAGSKKALSASTRVDLGFIGPPEFPSSGVMGPGLPDESHEVVDLRIFGTGIGSSSFEGELGQLTTQRGGWEVGIGEHKNRGLSFLVELGTEASFYDFGGGGSPVTGVNDPFNDVYDTHLAGRFLYRGAGRLEVYGGVQLGNAGEDAVGLDDSVYAGAAAALRYNANAEFALLIGVAGLSRFDDSPWILPYIGFDWRVSEDLRVKTEAAEIHADYSLCNDWTLGLEAVYDFRQYRLNESGPLSGGSFRDEEIRLGGSIAWEVREGVTFELSGGQILWRELVFHDGDAGELAETELNPPYYMGLGLKVSF